MRRDAIGDLSAALAALPICSKLILDSRERPTCCSRRRSVAVPGGWWRRFAGGNFGPRRPADGRRPVRGVLPVPANPEISTTPAIRSGYSIRRAFLLGACIRILLPIYIILTMRLDFIRDCIDCLGSWSREQRRCLGCHMQRDALRLAITGPVAVEGGDQDAPFRAPAPELQWRRRRSALRLQHVADAQLGPIGARRRPRPAAATYGLCERIDSVCRTAVFPFTQTKQQTKRPRGWDRNKEKRIASVCFKALDRHVFGPQECGDRPADRRAWARVRGGRSGSHPRSRELRLPGRSFLMPCGRMPLKSSSIVDL